MLWGSPIELDCPVANEYGARDAGILAYTCPSGGIHIIAENCIIEVLDPVTYEPVPNGQSGMLAITNLTNYVQPRLRYMLGDMGTLSTEECCCGRRLPLVPIIEKELLQRREEQMQIRSCTANHMIQTIWISCLSMTWERCSSRITLPGTLRNFFRGIT